jgi:hypothetical protein
MFELTGGLRLPGTALLLSIAGVAAAQPTAWSSQDYFVVGEFRYALRVLDLGVGATTASFDAPPGVTLGAGALTPDGRYYLVATSLGLARFTTTPPAFDRLLGPATAVAGVSVAPIGTNVHVTGSFGHAVLDWQTGEVRSVRCCSGPSLEFTPDGTRYLATEIVGRYPATQTTVTLYDVGTDAALWSRTMQGSGSTTVNNTHIAISIGDQALIFDTATGADQGSIPYALGGMRWRGETLVAFRTTSGLPGTERLSTFTLPSLAETVQIEGPYYGGRIDPIALYLSADGRYAYWLHWVSLLGLSVSNTSYSVFDLDEHRYVASGYVGYQSQRSLSLTTEQQCVFAVPDGLTVPARGGVIDVPVVPTPNCRPWLAPGALNPGPHTAAVTIREQVEANSNSQPENTSRAIGGTSIRITQTAERPAAPVLRGALEANRIHLRWDPSPGAGITAFEIRGAALGGSDNAEIVASTRRDWLSPPLGPGSYLVRIAAGNKMGLGPSSNDVRFSIGVATAPDPPTGLAAAIVDDQVTLTWQGATTAPAPSGYVVEAAAAGTSAFAAVARSADERLFATRVPAGPWQVRVRAVTDGGASAPTDPVTIAPSRCTAPPGPPRALWTLRTYPAFTLTWSPPATGSVEQYVIEAGTLEGAANLGRVVLGGDQTAITLPTIDSNSLGFARIRARNACGESTASSDVVIQRP